MTRQGARITRVEAVAGMTTSDMAGVNSTIEWRLNQLSEGSGDLNKALVGLAKSWGYDHGAAYVATRGKDGWDVLAAGEAEELKDLLGTLDNPSDIFDGKEPRDYSSVEELERGAIAICRRVADGCPSTGILLWGGTGVPTKIEKGQCFEYKMIIEICALARSISVGMLQVRSTAGPGLSEEEIGLLNLTKQGHSARAIALMLGLTAGQVNHRVKRVCERLGCSNRVELIAFAIQTGMIASN